MRSTLRRFLWPMVVLLAFALYLSCSLALADNMSAFDYLEAYHSATTDAEQDALVRRAYEEKGDEPLRCALELLYVEPFPSHFSQFAMEDFVARFSQIAPPDPAYLDGLSSESKQPAQIIVKMAGIGYEELFARGLMDKVEQSPNTVVRLWLQEDPAAWPKAVPHLAPDDALVNTVLDVPEERLDAALPWGVTLQPDDTLSVQTIFIGESYYDDSLYYELQLGMLSLAPAAVRARDPWSAMYAVVVRERTKQVATYTNGKGAYCHDLVVEIYKVATKEAIRSFTVFGSGPPALVSGNNEGHGDRPDRADAFQRAMDDFVWTFVDKMI